MKHHSFYIPIVFICLILVAVVLYRPSQGEGFTAAELTSTAIIDATNTERINAGLTPLRTNAELAASARIKTTDMIEQNYFEHDSPQGMQISDLAHQAGYAYVIVGENLARGNFDDAKELVEEWMKSPGHRANILSPKYQEIGVSIGSGMYDAKTVWYAVQHFGTDRDACPRIDGGLKPVIDSLDKDLTQRRAQVSSERALLSAPNRPEGEEYKNRVTAYNQLVAQYNTALLVSQQKIKIYNAQVAAFNDCLLIYRPVQ